MWPNEGVKYYDVLNLVDLICVHSTYSKNYTFISLHKIIHLINQKHKIVQQRKLNYLVRLFDKSVQ